LEEFTAPRTLEELQTECVAARARSHAGEVIADRERVRLARLRDELPRCVIRAPRDGMAIYAGGARDAHDDTNQPVSPAYVGAKVRRHQTLLRLADLSQLQIKLPVPEKAIGRLRRGQRVHVVVLDHERQGEIVSIDDRPTMHSVADVSFAHYAVGVAVDGIGEQWKPGMTASVEVLIERKTNVLTVPVVCLAKHGDEPCLCVQTLGGPELRKVAIGVTNDVVVEIASGVSEGERVLLNPVLAGDP
jgi:multidrug efflux pump subunit AcrA (membrane-fusion protein)